MAGTAFEQHPNSETTIVVYLVFSTMCLGRRRRRRRLDDAACTSSISSLYRGVRSVPLETPGIQYCSGKQWNFTFPCRWPALNSPFPLSSTVFDYPSLVSKQVHLSFLIVAAPRQIMIALISFDSRLPRPWLRYAALLKRERVPQRMLSGDKPRWNLFPVIGISDAITIESGAEWSGFGYE